MKVSHILTLRQIPKSDKDSLWYAITCRCLSKSINHASWNFPFRSLHAFYLYIDITYGFCLKKKLFLINTSMNNLILRQFSDLNNHLTFMPEITRSPHYNFHCNFYNISFICHKFLSISNYYREKNITILLFFEDRMHWIFSLHGDKILKRSG